MARPKRWTESSIKNGVMHTKLTHWKYFSDYVSGRMLEFPGYVYRGQRSDKWLLESSLQRLINGLPENRRNGVRESLLGEFKYAARGRINSSNIKDDNDWWALGQHYGLATPLLDWTLSPFVALYFAASEERHSSDGMMSIFAVHVSSISEKADSLGEVDNAVKVVRPLTDSNGRLVSQSGLFLSMPEGYDLEKWVVGNFDEDDRVVLLKISIPAKDRSGLLVFLNRMNINSATLFPDLIGASTYCNMRATVAYYGSLSGC